MSEFKVYDMALEMVREVSVLARKVEAADRDLARQMRRASTSVPLNIAEGRHSRGGNRACRYHTAMGSARETVAALEVSVAAQYLGENAPVAALGKLDQIVAMLWKLTH